MRAEILAGLIHGAAAAPAPALADFAQWRAGFQVQGDTFAAAVSAGLGAGQLAFCFAGGYQAALRKMLPTLAPHAFAALLLSEGKRQRPDELLTALTPLGDGRFHLDGEKSYVTGGAAADPLLVIARHGVDAAGRVRAALVVLPPSLPGVQQADRTDMGFLAALPHGRARFEGVVVEPAMIATGDGWTAYARPFRTLEDIHVSAAVAAHVLVNALRRGFPPPLLAALYACIDRLGYCAQHAPDDPAGHLLLAAAERELQQCVAQVNELLSGQDDDFARDWRANHLLVALAAPARARRLEKALALLRQGAGS